jgi:hypothetical protein
MKFVKGCLILLAVVFLLLFAGGAYLYINREEIGQSLSESFGSESLPEFARPETALTENADVIAQLDEAAAQSTSFFQFAAAVEALELPREVIYVGAEIESDEADDIGNFDDKETEILKRLEWNTHSIRIVDNVGLATLGTDDGETTAVVIQRTGPWDYLKNFTVYIKHAPATPPPSPATN